MKYLILMLFISSQALAGYILKRRIYMPSRKIQNLDAYSVNMGSKTKILKRVKEFINEKTLAQIVGMKRSIIRELSRQTFQNLQAQDHLRLIFLKFKN